MKKISFSLIALILLFPTISDAIGPRTVTSGGLSVKWASQPVPVDVETDLNVGGKDVTALVNEALDTWEDLSDSNVTFDLGSLGTAVNEANICTFFFDSSACPSGPTNDGTNPLVIDEDGEITSDFFGASNKFTTLGFASIVSFNSVTGAAVKGEAVFNAACLDGFEVSGCERGAGTADDLSFSDNDFTSFIVHEMGHFLGLDHSQLNLDAATDGSTANDNLINTMFPIFIVGNGGNFKTPERDDEVGLAQLYPSASFLSSTWILEGIIFDTNGVTELQCANVVARNVADPDGDAIAALSGDFSESGEADGTYEIPGLVPGASYTIDVEPIGNGFTGASGYTPCRGTNGEDSPPDFDAITSSSSFSGSAGATVEVDCTVEDDCGDAQAGGGSAGGCSLIP